MAGGIYEQRIQKGSDKYSRQLGGGRYEPCAIQPVGGERLREIRLNDAPLLVAPAQRHRELLAPERTIGDVPHLRLDRLARDERLQVLRETRGYPYLRENAIARLSQARRASANAHLADRPLVNLGGKMWALFPWLGTYAFLALERFLKIRCADRLGLKGLDSVRPYYMQFTMKVSEEEFFEIVKEEAEKEFDPLELVYPGENPVFEKYDQYVPEELVRKGFAYGVLDIEGMKKRVLGWDDPL